MLKPAAREESAARCMDGTRVNILTQVRDWIADVEAQNILWIKGSPGAGKSAIAASVVVSLGQHRGPSFFFKHDKDDLNNPMHLWRSIAYDLALARSAFRESITSNVNAHGLDPSRIDVEDQFKYLIEEPVATCARVILRGATPVVVIDALDECRSDVDISAQWKALLGTIKKWSSLSKGFKLVVTSRDHYDIGEALADVSQVITLETGDHVSSETSSDIQYFLGQRLAGLQARLGPLEWPGHTIRELVAKAQGLFIWAKVAMDCLEDVPEMLDDILEGYMDYGGNHIDKLYRKLLERSFSGPGEKLLPAFKMVAGIIVLSKAPLLMSDIGRFLTGRLQPSTIASVIIKLKAIIFGSSSVPLRVCHQSVSDFLLDPNRSGNFALDDNMTSQMMALACLEQMNHKDGLKFNILGLETSYCLNSDISDLEKQVAARIPSYLLYSCHFWMDHLRSGVDTSIKKDILAHLRDFLHHRFLFWLEVRSLTERVNNIPGILRQVSKWIGVSI